MKKALCLVFCALMLISSSACGMYSKQELDDTWREGYNEGYDDGLAEGEPYWSDFGREEGYDDGYRDGYSDGYDKGSEEGSQDIGSLVWDAEQYARKNGGWNPEEAMCIIDDYYNHSADYLDHVPTKEEYEAAVSSLYYFYEFFYSR